MTHFKKFSEGLMAFGLTAQESEVYIAGLELGSSTILELSRQTQISRTTLYPLLKRLCQKGVFRYGRQKQKGVYLAEAPETLKRLMQEKQEQFTSVLESLAHMHLTTKKSEANMEFYEGTDGFKRLWKQLLHSGVKEYRMITSGVGLLDYVKEPYLVERLIAERITQGIRSKQLITDSRKAREIIQKDESELRESRLLPAGIALPATMIIFAEHVAFITTRRENAMVILASGDVAITCQTLFDLLWELVQYRNENTQP